MYPKQVGEAKDLTQGLLRLVEAVHQTQHLSSAQGALVLDSLGALRPSDLPAELAGQLCRNRRADLVIEGLPAAAGVGELIVRDVRVLDFQNPLVRLEASAGCRHDVVSNAVLPRQELGGGLGECQDLDCVGLLNLSAVLTTSPASAG